MELQINEETSFIVCTLSNSGQGKEKLLMKKFIFDKVY